MSEKINGTPERVLQDMFLVLNLVESIQINDERGYDTTLRFSKLGFFGVCPVFVTDKGAKDYVAKNGLNENQIIKIKG